MLKELLQQNQQNRVLDVGCGTGRHVAYFASYGFEVYGFDRDESSVASAKETLRTRSLGGDLRTIDMNDTFPYQAGFFDAALAVRVVHHTYTRNIVKIIREIDRVLEDGGFLFLQVPSYETETFDDETVWAEPGTLIARGGAEKGVPHHFFKREELLALIPNYGVLAMHAKSDHYGGYCLIAQKKEANQSRPKAPIFISMLDEDLR